MDAGKASVARSVVAPKAFSELAAEVPFYVDRGIPAIVRKEDVRGKHNELIHPAVRDADLELESTSGSTGIPLRFFESEPDREIQHECHCRLYLLLDNHHARAVNVSDLTSDEPGDPLTSLIYRRDGEELVHHQHRMLSTRDPCAELAARVVEEAPSMLEGYPSALVLIARKLIGDKAPLRSVDTICPVGELIDDETRTTLRQAFPNASIYGRYGASELGALAWQCPLCDRYHFNADHFAVDVNADGRVLISKRYPSAFQLIHYDLGDNIRLTGFGGCEVNLPTIEILSGRRDDVLHDAEGNPLPIMPFRLGDMPELLQWQIIQRADLSLEVHAIVSTESAALAAELERRVRHDLNDPGLPITVRFSDRLASHKLKRVVSERG